MPGTAPLGTEEPAVSKTDTPLWNLQPSVYFKKEKTGAVRGAPRSHRLP